jgi:chemotaxis protein histidine kinase CheA
MLSEKFNFSLDEGLRVVGVEEKKLVNKDMILFPFSNEKDSLCCSGIRKACGLYLQCSKVKETNEEYCKGCKKECEVNGTGKPDYGTIEDRMSTGLYDFRDPKGKSPIGYLKYLSKVKKSKEEAESYALKEKKIILNEHFEYVEDLKRGRPKTEKKVKESTGKKGRPKKSKKEVELACAGDEEDLFALLVEDANSTNVIVSEEVEEGEIVEEVEKKTKKAEKEEEKQKKLAEKEAEKQKKLADKEAEKQKKLAEKEAEKQKKLAEKEAAKKNKKPTTKKSEKEVTAAPAEAQIENVSKEEEQDVVRKFDFEGVTYLKSKFTGVIYNMDHELIGKWNEETQKIDFEEFDDEEEEDEYDE